MKHLVMSLLCASMAVGVNAQAEKCWVEQSGDTLKIGNNCIARTFFIGSGDIRTLSLSDFSTGRTFYSDKQESDFRIGNISPEGKVTVEQFRTPEDERQPAGLVVSVSFRLGSVDVKREYVICDDVPAIACETYLRGELNERDIVLDRLAFEGRHWHCKAVQFYDVTDDNNNLVRENDFVSFKKSGYKGNLLLARDAVSGDGIFFLKEAPCSDVQLGESDEDFTAEFGDFQVVGAGVLPGDVSTSGWVRLYGCVAGVSGKTELSTLSAVRAWQKTVLKQENMVMMNTWGDRGQDARVNESFCLAELEKADRLGITVFQIDDGWQAGKSPNSAFAGGSFDDIWKKKGYWTPDHDKFPRGLAPIVERGRELGVEIGLWFNPSTQDEFADWEKDAAVLIGLYEEYGIRIFKIDGVVIPTKKAEINLRRMLDKVLDVTGGRVWFNLDVTAGRRAGYNYFGEYGNLFLENRYTDWGNYYPCYTLRNLWQLSRYVPAEKLQIEFLNPWRNAAQYPQNDPYAPINYSFDYLVAISLMGQPLAWLEASNLPEEAYSAGCLLDKYKEVSADIHSGVILPVGEEPSGSSWTGFQSIVSEETGYLLVFREDNGREKADISTWLPDGRSFALLPVAGSGKKCRVKVGDNGNISLTLKEKNSFALFKYEILK